MGPFTVIDNDDCLFGHETKAVVLSAIRLINGIRMLRTGSPWNGWIKFALFDHEFAILHTLGGAHGSLHHGHFLAGRGRHL
jgi:hypothetical protein